MVTLHQTDSMAVVLVEAIRTGNLELLRRRLAENPALAVARIQNDKGGSARYSTSSQTGPVTSPTVPQWLTRWFLRVLISTLRC
jgi:hypothetical protein